VGVRGQESKEAAKPKTPSIFDKSPFGDGPGMELPPEPPSGAPGRQNLPGPESIKPARLVAIPDSPPPHEGALFDLPYTIDAPDMLIVEVLEALPGRGITGERLVRPDGTITLVFYGDLHVRGLTIAQAKEKVVLYLRKFLSDETLGLVGDDLDSNL